MKLHVVVPPGCAHLVPEEYGMMAFADIAHRDPSYLREYIQRKDVIMDNQIYEGEEGIGPAELAWILRAIQPRMVIIPDVRGDATATEANAARYEPFLRPVAAETGMLFAGAIQGRSHNEIVNTVKFWLAPAQDWIKVVAVPIAVPNRDISRVNTYNTVAQQVHNAGKSVHFLGIEKWPYTAETYVARSIDTLDTAEATNATIWGVDLEHEFRSWEGATDLDALVKRPPRFMTWLGYRDILEQRKELFWRNLKWLNHRLSGKALDLIVTQEESQEEATPTLA